MKRKTKAASLIPCLLLICAIISGCVTSSGGAKGDTAGTPVSAAPTQTASPAPDPTPTPEPEKDKDEFVIGDTSTLGDWEITVTDFYYTDKIDMSAYTYYHPDEGNQYAVVAAQVTNNGKEADTFLPTYRLGNDVRATVYYAEEYEYSASTLFGVDDDLHDSTMNPLTSKEGFIVFSLPDAVVNSEDSLSIVFSAGRNEITFSLR